MPVINVGRWGKYRIKTNKRLFLYPEEWLKMVKLLNTKQKITFELLLHTGARHNEVKHIKVSDIDFDRYTINLRITKVRSKERETRPTPRLITTTREFAKKLEKYLKKFNLGKDDYFPVLSNAETNRVLKDRLKKIGRNDWKDFSPHNIRKTTETWLLACGGDGFLISTRLGHSPETARKHYISPNVFKKSEITLIKKILYNLHERL